MAFRTLMYWRWQRPGLWPVAAFLAVVLVALHLMSDAVQRSDALSRVFVPLLATVLLGLSGLGLLLIVNLVKLVRRYRKQALGSRLTGRMVLLFALIALVPVSVVYYYSLNFLLHGIDSWFDVRMDQAMKDALELNKAALSLNQRVLLKYTERLFSDIQGDKFLSDFQGDFQDDDGDMVSLLRELREQSGARELALWRVVRLPGPGNGDKTETNLMRDPDLQESVRLLAFSSEDPTRLVMPDVATQDVLQQLGDRSQYVTLYPRAPNELLIRVLVRDPKERPLILHALYPTSDHVSELSMNLEDAYNRYRELAYLRQSLKFSFSLTLSLVVIFSLMAALVAAFHSARRLVAPIADLAEGTRAVAAGNLNTQLPVPRQNDELSFLVVSFNAMTRQLARARDNAALSQQQEETHRAYLETVLGRLSNGVMAFDAIGRLRTANTAAQQILKLDLLTYLGHPVTDWGRDHERLQPLSEALRGPLSDDQEWRAEVTLFSGEGRQVLLCRCSPFAPAARQAGHVLVFDDITALIRAQRDAAWGEVARRLAHEIKNPLTPIQLSAERLRRKYLHRLPEEDSQVLERATHTIIQQVEAMKTMVNAFSDYARPAKILPEPLLFDALIGEVMDLYRDGNGVFQVRLEAGTVQVKGDSARLRQVLHNLVKNAQEALESHANGQITVQTRIHPEQERLCVELQVHDNGPGFAQAVLDRLFEPYVTTKVKGTGLGLAIMKKIVEEHGGIIWAENGPGGGSCITLRLPALPLATVVAITETR